MNSTTDTTIVPKTETVAIADLQGWLGARIERISGRLQRAEAKLDDLIGDAEADGRDAHSDPECISISRQLPELRNRIDELQEVARKLAWVECVGPVSLKGLGC